MRERRGVYITDDTQQVHENVDEPICRHDILPEVVILHVQTNAVEAGLHDPFGQGHLTRKLFDEIIFLLQFQVFRKPEHVQNQRWHLHENQS